MNEQFLRHRQIGKQFFDVGSYERAAQEFESGLQIDPDNNYVRLKLARCWVHLNKRDKARRETDLALQTDPNDWDAYYLQSYTTRKWKTALESIDKALSLRPNSAHYYERRGYILTRQGRYSEAIQSLERALELGPEMASNHRQMADTLFDQAEGDFSNILANNGGLTRAKHEKVTFHVQTALRLEPESARSHSVEARLKKFDLEFEASLEKWQEVLRLSPTDKFAQNQLRQAKWQAQSARWQEKVWRLLYRWMPWPLRLPLTWFLMGVSFWWSICGLPGRGFLSGQPMLFILTFPFGAVMTRLLLRDWLQFVPDRFLDASLRPLKKPPLQ